MERENKLNRLLFNFQKIGAKYLLTNESGNWLLLDKKNFQKIHKNKIDSELEATLKSAGMLIKNKEDLEKQVLRYRQKHEILDNGPTLHIVVLTLRCNQNCVYCHASSAPIAAPGLDMDEKTAARVLDRIFESKSRVFTIEFQGGEPLLNFPVLAFMVKEARSRAKQLGKIINIKVCSNLIAITDEQLDFLVNNNVIISTS